MLKPMLFGGASKDDLPMESPLEAMLERTDRHLDNFSALVRPAPESRPRTSFTSKLPRRQISAFNLTLRQRLRVVPKAVPLLFNILRSARMYDGRFKATRSEASPEFIAELEVMARAAGARRTRVRACVSTRSTPTSRTCRSTPATSTSGCETSARCASGASASARRRPSTPSRGRAAKAACSASTTTRAATTSRATSAARSASPSARLATSVTTRSRPASRVTRPRRAFTCGRSPKVASARRADRGRRERPARALTGGSARAGLGASRHGAEERRVSTILDHPGGGAVADAELASASEGLRARGGRRCVGAGEGEGEGERGDAVHVREDISSATRVSTSSATLATARLGACASRGSRAGHRAPPPERGAPRPSRRCDPWRWR
jgi:hypothetical protein